MFYTNKCPVGVKVLCKRKTKQCYILHSILITLSTKPPTLHMQQFHPHKHTNMHICILPCGKHDWCARSRSDREGGTIQACCSMPPGPIKYALFYSTMTRITILKRPHAHTQMDQDVTHHLYTWDSGSLTHAVRLKFKC